LATALHALSPAKTVTGLVGGLFLGTATAMALGNWPLQMALSTSEALTFAATSSATYDTCTGSRSSIESNLPGSDDCEGYAPSSSLGSGINSSRECTTYQCWLLSSPMPCWPAARWCGLGIAIACLAVIGDLLESAFKRAAGIKVLPSCRARWEGFTSRAVEHFLQLFIFCFCAAAHAHSRVYCSSSQPISTLFFCLYQLFVCNPVAFPFLLLCRTRVHSFLVTVAALTAWTHCSWLRLPTFMPRE